MGILVDYFTAANDDAAAEFLRGGTAEFELDGRQIEPTVSLSSVEEYLGGRSFDEILDDEENSFAMVEFDEDDDATIIKLGTQFEQLLSASSPEALAAAAPRWALVEEMLGADPDDLLEFLGQLQALVRTAHASGSGVYCRVAP